MAGRASVIFVGLVVLALSSAQSAGAVCPPPPPYPGDGAPQAAIAQWMAAGAAARGIPPELPVMGSLVASGLQNLNYGDSDAVGYFQMRVGIWNQGSYAGYPENPELQLRWFVDQALVFRARRVAMGLSITDPRLYGEWVADVMRPAAQFRGLYQLRLDEARGLIGSFCAGQPSEAGKPTENVTPPTVDSTPPALRLGGRLLQPALKRRAVLVRVGCGPQRCVVAGRGTVRIASSTGPGRASAARRHVFGVSAHALTLEAGQGAVMRFRLGRRVRRAVRSAFARNLPVRARLAVTAVDPAGNVRVGRRTMRLRR